MATTLSFGVCVALASLASCLREDETSMEHATAVLAADNAANGAFGISVIISQEMLDKVLRREAPAILEILGLEAVSIDPAAEFNVVNARLEDVTFGVNVSISKVSIAMFKDLRIDVTIALDETSIAIRSLRVTPPAAAPKSQDWHDHWLNFQQSTWETLVGAGTHLATSIGNQAMEALGLKTFSRDLCLHSGRGSYDARLVALLADRAGDIGVGVMLRPRGSTASIDKPARFPMPFPRIYDDAARSRVGIFFEDGLLAAMTNKVIAAAFDTWVQFLKKIPFHQAIASSSVGAAVQAGLINEILDFAGVADDSNIQDVSIKIYREGEAGLFSDFGIGDAGYSLTGTTAILDFSNGGHGLLESIFSAAERRSLLGKKKELTEEDKSDDISALSLGLCPAEHWLEAPF